MFTRKCCALFTCFKEIQKNKACTYSFPFININITDLSSTYALSFYLHLMYLMRGIDIEFLRLRALSKFSNLNHTKTFSSFQRELNIALFTAVIFCIQKGTERFNICIKFSFVCKFILKLNQNFCIVLLNDILHNKFVSLNYAF